MGDRANCVVKDGDSEVFLYTHWGGEDLPKVVQAALQRQWRWDDGQYLARIIFEELIPPNLRHTETGFGITSTLGDNEHPLIVVDVPAEQVRFETEKTRTEMACYTLKEYCALGKAEYPEGNWRD